MTAPLIARMRARISIAKARPSAVAVIGPTANSTVVPPGKKKTLTSSADSAIGSDSSSVSRASWPITPASERREDDGHGTSTAGPTSPPRTTAAMAVTVASVALVSGLSRWTALGPGRPRNSGAPRRLEGRVGQAGAPRHSPSSAAGRSASSSSCSPCGKRAFMRRAIALTMR